MTIAQPTVITSSSSKGAKLSALIILALIAPVHNMGFLQKLFLDCWIIRISLTFKKSKNARNNKETNNFKLTNSFQSLATANYTENTTDEVSDTTSHQPVNKKVTVNTIAEQPVENKKRKTTLILGDSIVKRIQKRKLWRKVKQNVIVRSFVWANLDCMSHYAIPAVKNNLSFIIIHC